MKIVFMGTPAAAVPALQRCLSDGHSVVAVYTQPDRPSGRRNSVSFSAVKQFAIENKLVVLQPDRLRTRESIELLSSHRADAIVVVAYGRILPKDYLVAFPKGAINVHFSLLPKYRGAAPVTWAIVNGETITGITTMKMDAGLDTGPILLQSIVDIGPDETSADLMTRLSRVGADLLSETLVSIDEIKPRPQEDARATYAPMLKREDGFIDWQMPAAEISKRVRGFQPFPTAYTVFQRKKLTIWKAEPNPDATAVEVEPGKIVVAHGNDLSIACGEGTVLSIEELQPEGKRRMSTRDFLNGFRPVAGMCFGV